MPVGVLHFHGSQLMLRALDAVPSLNRSVDLCGATPDQVILETRSGYGVIIWGSCITVNDDPGADVG